MDALTSGFAVTGGGLAMTCLPVGGPFGLRSIAGEGQSDNAQAEQAERSGDPHDFPVDGAEKTCPERQYCDGAEHYSHDEGENVGTSHRWTTTFPMSAERSRVRIGTPGPEGSGW